MTDQVLTPDFTNTPVGEAVQDYIYPSLDGLSSNFLSGALPSVPIAGQIKSLSSDDSLLHYRNGAWHNIAELVLPVYQGQIAGTSAWFVPVPYDCDVVSVTVVSDTGTTSDGSNNWTVDLYDVTNAQSLFSSVPNTDGDEIVADTPWSQDTDQNNTLAAGDVLEVRVTETGAATNLARALVFVKVRRRFS